MTQLPPGNGVPPAVLAQDVEALQVAELYRNLSLGAGAALVGTILCVFVLGENGLGPEHVLWLGYGIIVAALALWHWTQRLISRKPMASEGGGDRVHDWTAPVNAWFWSHPRVPECRPAVS